MAKMFGLLKELTASRTLEKVLVREEARHPITKHVNSISLIRMEEEKSVGNNEVVVKNVVEPNKSDIVEPLEKVDRKDEVEDRTNDEPVRSTDRDHMGGKVRELVETPRSQPVKFYLKHKINKELIEGLAMLKKMITKKEDIGSNFVIPCNVGGLKYMDALVDQGSNVNVMPISTYNRLTDKKLVETDIRLSLASQSYIYPLGIVEDVLVEIAGFIYSMDFIILDIKEDRKRSFILGMPFLTTTKAEIRFDKGTITLKSGKSKTNFFKTPSTFVNSKKEKNMKLTP
ncbi:MAK10-like protein [Tanacetum coccineum]